MRVRKPRPVFRPKAWAYFSPDGHIQVRSIGTTKAEAREFMCQTLTTDWQEYERLGFTLHRISWQMNITDL